MPWSGVRYVMPVRRDFTVRASLDQAPERADTLVAAQPKRAWTTLAWPEGSHARLRARFVALACWRQTDTLGWVEGWLIGEVPPRGQAGEPRWYWSNFPPDTPLAKLVEYGEELVGPIREVHTQQSKRPDGFTHADFVIDLEAKQVTCPGGQTTVIFSCGDGGSQATFPARFCRECPLRPRCCTGKKAGRSLRFGPAYAETQAARSRQTTEAFKEKYRKHRGGIEGCLSTLVWGHGMRRNRYRRRATNRIRALYTAAAVNLARAAAWRAGYRPRKHQPNLGLAAPAASPAAGAEQ